MTVSDTDNMRNLSQRTACFATDQVNKKNAFLILQEVRSTYIVVFDVEEEIETVDIGASQVGALCSLYRTGNLFPIPCGNAPN